MVRLGRGDDYVLTAVDKWQIQLLEDAGYLLEDIQREIARRTPYLQQEIAEAMEDAGVRAIRYDNKVYEAAGLHPSPIEESPALIRIMQRNFEATMGEMLNFTGTLAQAAQQAYIKACDDAYYQVLSGSLGYTQAVREAVNNMVSDGVMVRYPSGHTDTIETATLRAVRTGISQASGQITDARMEEMDWDIVLVSSHLGARVTDAEDFTNHFWWQGKFYSKSGKDPRFPPFSVCGMGDVQGIHGANCRHSHGPGDGEFNPYKEYDSEENRKRYELEQRQRTLERRIRKTKREVMGLNEARNQPGGEVLEADYQRKAALLQKQNAAYNQFCEGNGLKKLQDRISIAKWDRTEAAQARAAAKRREKSLQFIDNDVTIKATSGLPKKLEGLPIEKLSHTVNVNIDKSDKFPNGFYAVAPKDATLQKMEVMAGGGTSTPIRDLRRLYETYGLSPEKWQKKSGTTYGEKYHYVIHWYEHDGFVPIDEIKLKGMKPNK